MDRLAFGEIYEYVFLLSSPSWFQDKDSIFCNKINGLILNNEDIIFEVRTDLNITIWLISFFSHRL